MDSQSASRGVDPRSRVLGITIIGLVIVAFGIALLAENLGIAGAHQLLGLWPLALVLIGIALLIGRRHEQLLWGIALILAGAWGYATQRHWLHVEFWAVFAPALIILVGGSIIWRAFARPAPLGAGDAYVRAFAVLSGSEMRPTVPFQGAQLTAVMGGVKLDLLGAPMAGDVATIDVFGLMGGTEILVPSDWDVTIRVVALMGGCEDKRRPAAVPATKQLIVRGIVVMGGVEIKN